MKKNLIILLILIFTIKTYGQTGFLGKRNIVSTDIFNTLFQNKYNLNYNYCLGKTFMLKASYSFYRYSNRIYSPEEDYFYTGNSNDVLDVFLKGHSWELGFDGGYFYLTNMPLPIGYYFGMAFEHFSGTINETHISNNTYSPPAKNKYAFDNKANVIKLVYGKNSYIRYNFIIKTSIEIGAYIGSAIENDSTNLKGRPAMVLPFSKPFNKYNVKYEGAYNKSRRVTYYLMPNISLGYIF